MKDDVKVNLLEIIQMVEIHIKRYGHFFTTSKVIFFSILIVLHILYGAYGFFFVIAHGFIFYFFLL